MAMPDYRKIDFFCYFCNDFKILKYKYYVKNH